MAKVGRPTKYTAKACETVLKLGAEGASRTEWAAELDISFRTLLNWEEEHPEFLQATTHARLLAQAWWEKQGRKGIWSRDFNASAYRLQVMNRFPEDWRDKQDIDFRTPDGIQVEEIPAEEVEKRANRLANRLKQFSGPSSNGGS